MEMTPRAAKAMNPHWIIRRTAQRRIEKLEDSKERQKERKEKEEEKHEGEEEEEDDGAWEEEEDDEERNGNGRSGMDPKYEDDNIDPIPYTPYNSTQQGEGGKGQRVCGGDERNALDEEELEGVFDTLDLGDYDGYDEYPDEDEEDYRYDPLGGLGPNV